MSRTKGQPDRKKEKEKETFTFIFQGVDTNNLVTNIFAPKPSSLVAHTEHTHAAGKSTQAETHKHTPHTFTHSDKNTEEHTHTHSTKLLLPSFIIITAIFLHLDLPTE